MVGLAEAVRDDAVAYATSVFRHAVKKAGGNPAAYEEVLVLKKGQLGYAFHKSTGDDVLAPLQRTVDEMHGDGSIKKIIEKLLSKRWNKMILK